MAAMKPPVDPQASDPITAAAITKQNNLGAVIKLLA